MGNPIAEALVRNRLKKRMNESYIIKAPDEYLKKAEEILNHQLAHYETGVKVLRGEVVYDSPGTVVVKVDCEVNILIPIVNPKDHSTHLEDEVEHRTQTVVLEIDYKDQIHDRDDMDESEMPNDEDYDAIERSGSDEDYQIYALSYMYGMPISKIKQELQRGEFSDKEIHNALTWFNLRDLPVAERLERYAKLKEDLTLDDDPEETEQQYTSAATSINSNKLPALFSMVDFKEGSINLDYGGGRFDNVAEYLESEYGATNLVYDKYNRSAEHNKEVLSKIRQNGGADTVTCSNVLNVIAEESERLAVLRNCKRYLKSGGTCYITVYEGSGTGEGAPTKAGYQLNRKTKDYEEEIKKVFSSVNRKGKLFICQ